MTPQTATMTTSLFVKGKTLDYVELAAVMGREPTSTWKCKPHVAAQVPELDGEGWTFELADRRHWSFSDGLDELLTPFMNHADAIVSYCRTHELSLSAHVHTHDPLDRYVLAMERPETIQMLARLNAAFSLHCDSPLVTDDEVVVQS